MMTRSDVRVRLRHLWRPLLIISGVAIGGAIVRHLLGWFL